MTETSHLLNIQIVFLKETNHYSLLISSLAAKNGIYIDLVKDVRDAFEECRLVKINCEGMHASDYKKIGAKLMVCDHVINMNLISLFSFWKTFPVL